jgi:hydrogenase nickel incorporation protein HypA/HybF
MHELSLALEVIDLATREAEKNEVTIVCEILIEIGDLSGIEADAFKLALDLLAKDSILENATRQFIRTPGKGKCTSCDLEFEMKQMLSTCPECNCYPSEITGGREFRVVSMTGE